MPHRGAGRNSFELWRKAYQERLTVVHEGKRRSSCAGSLKAWLISSNCCPKGWTAAEIPSAMVISCCVPLNWTSGSVDASHGAAFSASGLAGCPPGNAGKQLPNRAPATIYTVRRFRRGVSSQIEQPCRAHLWLRIEPVHVPDHPDRSHEPPDQFPRSFRVGRRRRLKWAAAGAVLQA